MGRLDNKVAIITGSVQGIGREIALRFATEGADIVIADVQDTRMQETAEAMRNLGRKAIAVKADISKKEDVERLVAVAIDTFRQVDILVNNAGIIRTANLEDITELDWDDIFNVNLKGTFFCIQAIMRHMMARRYGKIINISSQAGIDSNTTPKIAHYACAKAGVIQLTKIAARALAQFNINVNSIAPGIIATEASRLAKDALGTDQVGLKATALGRWGVPLDIANLALFLASDESSFITGQTISCNGGRFVQ